MPAVRSLPVHPQPAGDAELWGRAPATHSPCPSGVHLTPPLVRMGDSPSGTPGQAVRRIHRRRNQGGLPGRLLLRAPSGEGCEQHAVRSRAPRGGSGIPGQGTHRMQGTRPLPPIIFPGSPGQQVRCNSEERQEQWHLILDLSSPEGRSVNNGIPADLCSLSYVSVDNAARAIVGTSRRALLTKINVASGYRIVSVHPEDRLLLGMLWDGDLYVDMVLPFGLRSAPKIFTALADALEWIVRQAGVEVVLHYLDDFLLVGRTASAECGTNLDTLLGIFERLRIPVVREKLEGPATLIMFLGIELDTGCRVPD